MTGENLEKNLKILGTKGGFEQLQTVEQETVDQVNTQIKVVKGAQNLSTLEQFLTDKLKDNIHISNFPASSAEVDLTQLDKMCPVIKIMTRYPNIYEAVKELESFKNISHCIEGMKNYLEQLGYMQEREPKLFNVFLELAKKEENRGKNLETLFKENLNIQGWIDSQSWIG
jgi:hypothetical protein